jgi:hypothetical protein
LRAMIRRALQGRRINPGGWIEIVEIMPIPGM